MDQLKSELSKVSIPQNEQFFYKLSGLGGSGELFLTFGEIDENQMYVHVRCIAGIKFLKEFHFEGLSKWEKNELGYGFQYYEEKDFSKKIHKKWEFTSEGLNYVENKKGLILEREVQYFNPPKDSSIIFDPISAATVALMEKKDRRINIFGKQRILQVDISNKMGEMSITPQEGFSATWSKILEHAKIRLTENGLIKKIEIPSPIQVGTLKMDLETSKKLTAEEVLKDLSDFNKNFEETTVV